jgi:hypothetical protein
MKESASIWRMLSTYSFRIETCMGATFTHLVVLGPDLEDVISCIRDINRRAYVGPTVRGWTLIAEEDSESFDFAVVRAFAERVSTGLKCPAISVQFYDDDVFLLQVYSSGAFIESYSSNPAYGASEISEMLQVDRGGDVEKIALALNKPEVVQALQAALHGQPEELDSEFEDLSQRMAEALRIGDIDTVKAVQLRLMEKTREMSESGDDPFLKYAPGFDARRRFTLFVNALQLPSFSQDFGYCYLDNGEELSGLDSGLVRKIDGNS